MDMNELLEGLSYNEKRLLLALDKNNGRGSPADMIRIGGFGLEVEVMGSASWLASKGLAEISEESTKYYELTESGQVFLSELENGWEELARAIELLRTKNDIIKI